MTRAFSPLPSQERLQSMLNYAPDTGVFTWRESRGPNAAGSPAGWVHKSGYVYIGFDKKYYKAHRIAWMYVYGREPKGLLDHIDRDPQNNRIANLRESTDRHNNQNKCAYKNNRAGVKGVAQVSGTNRWRARIQADKKMHHLGTFATFEEALQARLAAEQALHIS